MRLEEPFTPAGVCAFLITEFTATKTDPELPSVREQLLA